MNEIVQIEYEGIEPKKEYEELIQIVMERCFKEEQLLQANLYIAVTLTTSQNIRTLNQQYRNIDKETDVLSFPMFEKEEIQDIQKQTNHTVHEVLGDIVISIARVEEQATEYGHSFERELAYMLVHGFYHLMGYDHIEEKDKLQMRPKEETILQDLKITRN